MTDIGHGEMIVQQADERAEAGGRVIVLGASKQQGAAPLEIPQVHVIPEGGTHDLAVWPADQNDFWLGIVPFRPWM